MKTMPLPDRKECPGGVCACGATFGSIEEKNGQDVTRCHACGKWLFNASRVLTGREARTLSTTHAAITPKIRNRILERANGRCEVCGLSSMLTVGHVVSVKDGHAAGLTDDVINSDENLICQCAECNSGTSSRTIPLRMYVRILVARTQPSL